MGSSMGSPPSTTGTECIRRRRSTRRTCLASTSRSGRRSSVRSGSSVRAPRTRRATAISPARSPRARRLQKGISPLPPQAGGLRPRLIRSASLVQRARGRVRTSGSTSRRRRCPRGGGTGRGRDRRAERLSHRGAARHFVGVGRTRADLTPWTGLDFVGVGVARTPGAGYHGAHCRTPRGALCAERRVPAAGRARGRTSGDAGGAHHADRGVASLQCVRSCRRELRCGRYARRSTARSEAAPTPSNSSSNWRRRV